MVEVVDGDWGYTAGIFFGCPSVREFLRAGYGEQVKHGELDKHDRMANG